MKTKKALAYLVAVLFAINLCPLCAFAEDLGSLTSDDVTGSQTSTAIVNDLTLPAGYQWTSSDEDIISIGEESEGVIPATVTRNIGEDKEVTLTASNGSDSKDFNLTVKAKETTVFLYGTSAGGNHDVFTKYSDRNGSKTEDNLTIEKDADGNYYQKYDYTPATNYDTYSLTTEELVNAMESSVITFEFDFIYKQTTSDLPVDLRINVGGTTHRLARWNKGRIYPGSQISASAVVSDSDWNHVVLKFSVYTGEINMNVNGTNIPVQKCYASSVAAQTYLDQVLSNNGITDIYLAKGAQNYDCGVFSLDNFCVYGTVLKNLSKEDQQKFIENINWSEFTEANASIMQANTIVLDNYDGFINWSAEGNAVSFNDVAYTNSTSTASKVYAESMTITQPSGNLSESIILKATSVNGADYGEKKFNISVMPEDFTTDLNSNGTADELLHEDFENGVFGSDVTKYVYNDITTLTNNLRFTSVGGTIHWGVLSGSEPSFTYVNDSEKGSVGKLSGNGKDIYLRCGTLSGRSAGLTSADVKFTPGSDAGSKIELSLLSAGDLFKIIITEGNISINQGGASALQSFDVDTNNWINIAVESNFASRTNNLYINGVKVNEIPIKSLLYTATSSFSNNQRGIKIVITGSAEMLVDNIYSIANANEDEIKAEAGVQAAQVYYKNAYMTGKALEAKGPAYSNAAWNFADGFAMDNGASLVWSGKDVVDNVFAPTTPAYYTLTVASSINGETATGEIVLKAAPVIIKVEDDYDVKLSGNTENGTLIIASMNEDKLESVKMYTSFENINIADLSSYKIIFIDNIGNLVPLAYSVSK